MLVHSAHANPRSPWAKSPLEVPPALGGVGQGWGAPPAPRQEAASLYSAGEPAGGRSLAPMFRDSVAGATAQLGSLRPQGQDPHEDQTRSGPRKEDESCSCCLSP